ncbi:hypothetical protein BN128_2218 [Cronobacter sakazakii 696]|nr:hypothetical protein BN129_1336 [Cronobacter sakazakii 701]CCK08203.1 hypothetical protein BN128_2218 [Cronobacter sakazakii 696]
MLKCSGAGAGALFSQSVEPLSGGPVGLPQASALLALFAAASALPVSHGFCVWSVMGGPLAI